MLLSVILALSSLLCASECWELDLRLYVPRIYNNTESQGVRKYQWQRLHGYFTVTSVLGQEPEIEFCSLENLTHKVNGKRVTYEVQVDPLWHGIGSNKTGAFKTRSVSLQVVAEPSYAIGPEPTEDNSLWLTLAGYGNASGRVIKGNVAGQLGCGCKEYGHVSPTRIWGQSTAVDTAATFGTWKAKRIY